METKELCRRILIYSAGALAAAFFLLRFLYPGDTVYIFDEALFQIRIDEHIKNGTFPWIAFVGSSLPIPYGGGGLWFYFFLRLFTWHPIPIVLAHITVQVAAALLLLSTFRRAYGKESTLWVALLVATSPLLFFFARQPWDNTLLIPVGALILWALERLPRSQGSWNIPVFLGVVVGYGLNIHLMMGPVALALGLTLFIYPLRLRKNMREAFKSAFLYGLTAFLTLVPYLIAAYRETHSGHMPPTAPVPQHWGDARNLWWILQRTAIFSSLFGADVYLHTVRESFFAFTGPALMKLFKIDVFGWFGKLLAWGSAFAVLFGLARRRIPEDAMALFAGLAFFFTLLVIQYLNIPTAPHYFNPMWWFVFLGIARTLPRLNLGWRRFMIATIVGTALVNALYVGEAFAFIHRNRGARNMQVSVVVEEQLRNLRVLCAWAKEKGKAEVRLRLDAEVAQAPFLFLPKHMPECEGVTFSFEGDPKTADFRLHHPNDSTTSAALVAEPIQP